MKILYEGSVVRRGKERNSTSEELLMGLESDYEPSATPKLSLSKLPNKYTREPLVMLTPPTKTLPSIPFQWEEAPGKPRPHFIRATNNKSSATAAARCLDLPPRLLVMSNNIDSSKFTTNIYSPTTVLDGPDGGRSFSKNSALSSCRSLEEQVIREAKYDDHGIINGKRDYVMNKERSLNFTPWRWGSVKERNRNGGFANESFGFTSFASDRGSSKPPRFKRRSSFTSFSHVSSNFLAGIYGSFKQVVHWRRGQEQKKV